MTFGQMKILTDRFNQIKNTYPSLRNIRFETMLNDLVLLFPKDDLHAARMYAAICEEMEAA